MISQSQIDHKSVAGTLSHRRYLTAVVRVVADKEYEATDQACLVFLVFFDIETQKCRSLKPRL